MSEFKGTPGPWFEYRCGFSTVYIEARIGGGMIQEVAACGPSENGAEQQQANVNLIASAPDLLSALQQLMEIYDCTDGRVWTTSSRRRALDNARSAVNKALGE